MSLSGYDLSPEAQALDKALFHTLFTIVQGTYLDLITDLYGEHARYTFAIVATMSAYRILGDAATLDSLRDEEKKQKSHRCEVHAETGKLVEKANMPVTEEMRKRAINLMSRREWASWRECRATLSEQVRESE